MNSKTSTENNKWTTTLHFSFCQIFRVGEIADENLHSMLDTTKDQDNGQKMNGIANIAFEAHDAIEPDPDYEYSYIDHRGETNGMKRFVQPMENGYDGHDGKSKDISALQWYFKVISNFLNII